jgi:hypothetical protein
VAGDDGIGVVTGILRREDLESGKETSVRGYEGGEAAPAELTASRERLKVRAEALTGAGAAT